MSNHPWHNVGIGSDAPEKVMGIIEIPRNCRAKYELDKESGLLLMDRVLYSPLVYPANYGFIPQTFCDDGDPLDILVLSQIDVVPMCLVESKVIGVMHMVDGGEQDDKIIAVASNDMSVKHINDISELPSHILDEIRIFFEDYKKLEKKTVSVEGFEGREVALKVVEQSIVDYKEKFADKV